MSEWGLFMLTDPLFEFLHATAYML